MIAKAALAASLAVLAFVLGLALGPTSPANVPPRIGLRVADADLQPPAVRAARALSGIAAPEAPAARAAMPPAALPRPAAAPSPLPPPPVEAQLRGATAAVTVDGGRLALVLAGGGRRLHEGDGYMGWRLASLSPSRAVLSRGRERREVPLFGAPPSAGRTDGRLPAAPGLSPPPPVSGAQAPRPVTAEEFFRGFKG